MLSLNAAGFLDKPSVTLSGAERQIRPNKCKSTRTKANPPEQKQIRPNGYAYLGAE